MARLAGKQGLIVGVAAGSGFVAQAAARGGADFLLAINAARLRNMGAPSVACMLPLADAMAQVEGYATREVLPLVEVPVLFGANGWDPAFDAAALAERALAQGFAGLVNFPPSGLYPAGVQKRLERADIGFSREVRMLAAAQARGGIALAYCTSISQARQAALAGIENVLLNYGWNSGGAVSPTPRLSLDEAAVLAAGVSRQVRRILPRARILLEGGPVVSEDDLAAVLRAASIDGYIGGSTIERQPLERSISDQIARFRRAYDRARARPDPERALLAFGRRAGFEGQSPALLRFLAALRAAARARWPLHYLALPPGESAVGVIDTLARRPGSGRRGRTHRLDAEGLGGARAAAAELFGAPGRAGPCTDPDLDLLVIDAPETLAPSVQRRLADHVLGRAEGPRLVLVGRADGAFDARAALDPALGALAAEAVLRLPPLRERFEDVETILRAEIDRRLAPGAGGRPTFSPAALRFLSGHDWPGGTAELAALCAAFARRGDPGPVPLDAVEGWLRRRRGAAAARPAPPDQRAELIGALLRNGYRKGRTAQALGISRKTLYNRMKRYGIS